MFNFASAPAAPQSNNSQFSFGSQSSDKPSAPAFSFSAPTTNAVQNPQFSFTTPFINNAAATPFKFNAPTQNTEPETNENDDEEDGVKEDQIDSKAFMTGAGEEDETTQFETRCKLFKMENDKWELIGLGDLKIKLNKNGKRRFLLRADMSGRVLLNCGLFKGMPVKRLNPKQVFVKCAVEGNTLQDFLFQVKDKGVGDLFEQAIANAST